MSDTILIAALAVVLLLVIMYIVVKDRATARKLAMMEAAIDGMGQEIFKLSKEIEKVRKQLQEASVRIEMFYQRANGENDCSVLQKEVDRVNDKVAQLQTQVDGMEEEMKKRVASLDGKVRQVTFASEHAAPDEQRILKLHAQGYDSETIAKQLRLGKGEVELVLKFAKINA